MPFETGNAQKFVKIDYKKARIELSYKTLKLFQSKLLKRFLLTISFWPGFHKCWINKHWLNIKFANITSVIKNGRYNFGVCVRMAIITNEFVVITSIDLATSAYKSSKTPLVWLWTILMTRVIGVRIRTSHAQEQASFWKMKNYSL